MLVLVIESAVLYSWHANAAEAANQVDHRVRKVKHELELAKKVHADVTKVKKEITELSSQVRLFDSMKAEKIGPVDALHFLSFILQVRDPATWPRDEQKLMEAAGWRIRWDARRAWFTHVEQNSWMIDIKGRALAHEDVAEVLRRLESSPYFRNVKLKFQVSQNDSQLNAKFVAFSIEANLLYLIKPWSWPPREEPEAPPPEQDKAAEELPNLPSSIKTPQDAKPAQAPTAPNAEPAEAPNAPQGTKPTDAPTAANVEGFEASDAPAAVTGEVSP